MTELAGGEPQRRGALRTRGLRLACPLLRARATSLRRPSSSPRSCSPSLLRARLCGSPPRSRRSSGSCSLRAASAERWRPAWPTPCRSEPWYSGGCARPRGSAGAAVSMAPRSTGSVFGPTRSRRMSGGPRADASACCPSRDAAARRSFWAGVTAPPTRSPSSSWMHWSRCSCRRFRGSGFAPSSSPRRHPPLRPAWRSPTCRPRHAGRPAVARRPGPRGRVPRGRPPVASRRCHTGSLGPTETARPPTQPPAGRHPPPPSPPPATPRLYARPPARLRPSFESRSADRPSAERLSSFVAAWRQAARRIGASAMGVTGSASGAA